MLKALLDLSTKLMLDIDTDIEESWMDPPQGFKLKEDEGDDSLTFATDCVDRILTAGGEKVAIKPATELIDNLIQNDQDW